MVFSEVLRKVAKSRGYTITALAEEIGIKYGALASALRKGNPSVNAMNRYFGAMGYEVVVMPKGSRLPEGAYVLEPNREEA